MSVILAQLEPGLTGGLLCPPHPVKTPPVSCAAPAAAMILISSRREIRFNGMKCFSPHKFDADLRLNNRLAQKTRTDQAASTLARMRW